MKQPSILPSIGDTLVIAVSAESREWGYNPAPDGTRVTVVDFGRITYGRTNNHGLLPGIYLNRSYLDVRLPNGEIVSIGSFHVRGLKGESVLSSCYEDRDADRVADLPETPIWEEDIVETPDICDRHQYPNGLVVLGIDYAWVRERDYARVSDSINGGWHMSFPVDELTLIRRGPVWAYYHGDTKALASLSNADLIQLHRRLGLVREQRNPRTGDYSWTLTEALEDIRTGKADAISAGNGLFGSDPTLSVHRFDDREVGETARRLTIAGWANATPERLAEYDRPYLESRERVARMEAEIAGLNA